MNILQFQILNTTEQEAKLIPSFCNWLCDQMYEYINNKINRRKISLRIPMLYKANWIQWKNKQSVIGVSDIMEAIHKSFNCESYKQNIWKINTDTSLLIPNTNTFMDRLIRFIEFGDNKTFGTGMFTGLKKYFTSARLNTMWRVYKTLNNLEYESNVQIISD